MNLIETIVLSVIEGVTEFLPISSTGHLVIATKLLSIEQTNFVKDFEIIIQLSAILSIVFLYRRQLLKNADIWKRILTAFIPTAIVGFMLFAFIKNYLLGNLYITLVAMLTGGIALIALELVHKEKDHHVDSIENLPIKNAFLIGLFQSIAVIPGVSRSAATIISALFLGTKRKAATEFSFLLAVPTMLAATGLDIVKSKLNYSANEWIILAVGFIGSFVTATIVVKWFLSYIENHTFIPFGVYRVAASLIFWYFLLR